MAAADAVQGAADRGWHDLSDVRLAEALDDRASFRRFCGFASHEPTPERTSFVRFRRALVERGLDAVLFDEVTGRRLAKALRDTVGAAIVADRTTAFGLGTGPVARRKRVE